MPTFWLIPDGRSMADRRPRRPVRPVRRGPPFRGPPAPPGRQLRPPACADGWFGQGAASSADKLAVKEAGDWRPDGVAYQGLLTDYTMSTAPDPSILRRH